MDVAGRVAGGFRGGHGLRGGRGGVRVVNGRPGGA